ncbi:unnamed protein product [Brassica oleracea]|uniref:Uncharacterized protein n=1 Tax=Brassica oleracea TaxID=3712 RepID=A0A3P6GE01_BRAOL|nr:unnamed protein product [Brassica oleracea]
MGVAVLQPRDCLTDPLSIRNILHPPPQRPNKPTPNRRRRSPPRRQPETSPPPKGSKKKKKNLNHNHVRIPKRGEEKVPDLRSARQIVSDPVMIPSQSRRSTPALFYAGPKRLLVRTSRRNHRSDQNLAVRHRMIRAISDLRSIRKIISSLNSNHSLIFSRGMIEISS